MITIVNGIAEELFFRGALFAGIGVRHPVTISTILYTLATMGGGNPVLVFAAALLGTVVGLERRASGGVLGPILTHVTWSTAMLFLLPVDLPRLERRRRLRSFDPRTLVAVLLHVLGPARRSS